MHFDLQTLTSCAPARKMAVEVQVSRLLVDALSYVLRPCMVRPDSHVHVLFLCSFKNGAVKKRRSGWDQANTNG